MTKRSERHYWKPSEYLAYRIIIKNSIFKEMVRRLWASLLIFPGSLLEIWEFCVWSQELKHQKDDLVKLKLSRYVVAYQKSCYN